jgi:hypothetical protein
MKKVYPEIVKGANASKDAATASSDTAKAVLAANQINRAVLRAHISAPETPQSAIRINNDTFEVKIQIANTGESTARDVGLSVSLVAQQNGVRRILGVPAGAAFLFNDMPKGGTYERTATLGDNRSAEIKQLLDTGAILYVIGDIRFVDVFNEQVYNEFILFCQLWKNHDFSNFVPLETPPKTAPVTDRIVEPAKQKN